MSHDRPRLSPAIAVVTLFIPLAVFAQPPGRTLKADEIFDALRVGEGLTVCEIGAGDGELSIAAAHRVGPRGRVYSSELGDSRVNSLEGKVSASGLQQITVIAGDPVKTNFPDAGCDAVFMRNVYHHFDEPVVMDRAIAAALKPGGRVAVVDFTPPNHEASSPSERDQDGTHGVTPDSVERELKEAGFDAVSSDSNDGRWFMVVGTKPRA